MNSFWNTPIQINTDVLVGAIIVFSIFVWYCFDFYDGINEQQNRFERWRDENNRYRLDPENQIREYFIHLRKVDYQPSEAVSKVKLN